MNEKSLYSNTRIDLDTLQRNLNLIHYLSATKNKRSVEEVYPYPIHMRKLHLRNKLILKESPLFGQNKFQLTLPYITEAHIQRISKEHFY